MSADLKFTARKSWAWLDVELFGYQKTGGDGRVAIVQPVVLTVIDDNDPTIEPHPFLSLTTDSAQRLMDALWDVGLRPTEGTGSAGSLAATQAHLSDMRSIVAKEIGIELK